MKRTKLIYLVGQSEKELLAYDEYDSKGSGKCFNDNPFMANKSIGLNLRVSVPL